MPPATQADTPRKKKRRIKKLWIVLGSPVVLLLLLSIWAVWYQANLQSQIDAELAKIRALGEPATVAELAAVHRVPEGEVDRTQAWVKVLERVRVVGRSVSYYELHDKLIDESDTILTGGPWPNEAAVEQLMTNLQPTLREVEDLTSNPGKVRYPYDFSQGDSILLYGVDGVYELTKVLLLRAYWQVRHGQRDEALKSLRAIRQATETLEHEPYMNSQSARGKINRLMVETTLRLLPHANWSSAQLEQLQNELLITTMKQQTVQRTVVRHFVVSRSMFDHPETIVDDVPWTFAWTRRADELCFLQSSWPIIEASQRTSADFKAEFDALSQRWDSPGLWDKWHQWLTRRRFPFSDSIVQDYQESIAADRAVASLLACQRYYLVHSTWPTELSELLPEFLNAVPLDPMDQQPLRYRLQGNEVIVYSVGENLIDDGGVSPTQSDDDAPDDVFTLKTSVYPALPDDDASSRKGAKAQSDER